MSGTGGFATKQTAVDTTAGGTIVVAARRGREAATIVNCGTTQMWIGGKGVTSGTGVPLPGIIGASITIPTQDVIYAIADSGSGTVASYETF